MSDIVIIGATGAVGTALARQLHKQDQSVFLIGRNKEKLEALHEDIGAPYEVADVKDEGQIKAAISKADKGKGLAGLAYCVGTIDLKPLGKTNDSDFEKTFDINFMGAVRALRAAEAGLKEAGGSVVLFSTVAVQRGFPNHSLISGAKGAIEGLTRSLAAEWAPKVRVNAIAPSLSDTGIAQPLLQSEQMRSAIAKMHPMGRIGEAEDSAAAAAYLLGPQSGWVTGQILGVDGGRGALAGKG